MKELNGKFYHIETYGCQMNVHESEKIRGILSTFGMAETDNIEQATMVIFNTCCIREGAEDKAYSNIASLKKWKQTDTKRIIVVCGCMPQQKNGKYNFKKRLTFVDIVIGTHNINMLGQYLNQLLIDRKRIVEIVDKPVNGMETETCVRDDKINAYVNIIYGCDKFCTYCIVPHVRGRETSRPLADIYKEVKDLVQKQNYKYITLLGQNVNSYGKDLNPKTNFATLLTELCKIEGDFKIKFMTSHPMDFDSDLIKVMKEQDKIAKALHLPVQSGSTKVLKRMNRHYDIKHYYKLIHKVKHAIPNISLSTDIIVGFPGETEKDYNLTLKLLKKVKYDQVFAFMYSPRSGTPAATFEDQIDEKIKNKRVNNLLNKQKIIQKDLMTRTINKTYNCLIRFTNGVAMGITDGGREIYLPSYKFNNENYFANVKVEGIRNHKLSGVIIDD